MSGRLGGIADAFADRNFRIYSLGAIVSWLTFFVQMVALSWTTWDLTHSTGWLAAVACLDILPNILFLPLGGALADRIDRLRLTLAAYAAALLQSLALTVLAYGGNLTIGAIAALAFLHGLIHSFSVPGAYGMMPRFVARARLTSAIAVSASYIQLAIFAGPALAGWIILHFGTAAAFATNVAGYAFYFVTVAFLKTPADHVRPASSGRSILGDIADGFTYIAGHRGISALLALMLVGDAISASIYQMLPAFAATGLGMGVEGFSTLLSATGLGAAASALWLAHGGAARATPQGVLWAFLAFALAVAALMLSTSIVAATLVMLGYGMAGEIRRTGTVALLQVAVPDSQRGRVMATQFLLHRVAGGLGTIAIGAAAERHGLRLPMLVAAALALVAWTFAFLGRRAIASAFVDR